jgi:hypothetical protein
MNEKSIQSVYNKIRELSASGPGQRPLVSIKSLAVEMGQKMAEIKPYLLHLRKMLLITSDNDYITDIRLTIHGLEWPMMPR